MDPNFSKKLDTYRRNKYPITLIECEEGGYVATIEDLPGCMTQGETIDEAIEMIEEARLAWIEAALIRGRRVPNPGERQAVVRYEFSIPIAPEQGIEAPGYAEAA